MMTELEELLQQTNIQDIDILQSSEDSKAKKLLTLLDDIQGNILRNHGRNLAVHLFLEFKSENIDKAKSWISNFAENFVTSATQQWQSSKNHKQFSCNDPEAQGEPIPDTLFTNFFSIF